LNTLRVISSLKHITAQEWEDVEDNGGDASILGISQDNYYDLCDLYLEKLGIKHKIISRGKKLKKYAEAVANLCKDTKDLEAIQDYQEVMLEMPKKFNKQNIHPYMCKYYGAFIPLSQIKLDNYLDMYLEIPKDNGKH
jgi:hypothetical protein